MEGRLTTVRPWRPAQALLRAGQTLAFGSAAEGGAGTGPTSHWPAASTCPRCWARPRRASSVASVGLEVARWLPATPSRPREPRAGPPARLVACVSAGRPGARRARPARRPCPRSALAGLLGGLFGRWPWRSPGCPTRRPVVAAGGRRWSRSRCAQGASSCRPTASRSCCWSTTTRSVATRAGGGDRRRSAAAGPARAGRRSPSRRSAWPMLGRRCSSSTSERVVHLAGCWHEGSVALLDPPLGTGAAGAADRDHRRAALVVLPVGADERIAASWSRATIAGYAVTRHASVTCRRRTRRSAGRGEGRTIRVARRRDGDRRQPPGRGKRSRAGVTNWMARRSSSSLRLGRPTARSRHSSAGCGRGPARPRGGRRESVRRDGPARQAAEVRDQRTRWGSASRRGTLSFSWRLVLCPPRCSTTSSSTSWPTCAGPATGRASGRSCGATCPAPTSTAAGCVTTGRSCWAALD
jgi:hypothetical protein